MTRFVKIKFMFNLQHHFYSALNIKPQMSLSENVDWAYCDVFYVCVEVLGSSWHTHPVLLTWIINLWVSRSKILTSYKGSLEVIIWV